MGQYYTALVEDSNNKTSLFSGDSLKLMDTSWILNSFPNHVALLIKDNPSRVIWMGDYANGYIEKNVVCQKQALFNKIYSYVWKEKNKDKTISDGPIIMEKGFLINHDKKTHINLSEYCSLYNDDGWIVNPLPLLTALGNGEGGGDYHDCYLNFKLTGSWAYDLISYSDEVPEGFTDVTKTHGFIEKTNLPLSLEVDK